MPTKPRSTRPATPAKPQNGAASTETGNGKPKTGAGALPQFRPEQLIEGFGAKGPFSYPLCCPACAGEFIAGPFEIPPPPMQPMTCGLCMRGGIPFEAMRRGFENTQKFHGEPVTCERDECPTFVKTGKRQSYQPIMEGTGGYDPRTGKGGMRRSCPACGYTVTPKKAVASSAEDKTVNLNKILE